jgi:hypothetical protein
LVSILVKELKALSKLSKTKYVFDKSLGLNNGTAHKSRKWIFSSSSRRCNWGCGIDEPGYISRDCLWKKLHAEC